MHNAVRLIAEKIGAKLSERSAAGGYNWDGQSLALNYQEWDELDADAHSSYEIWQGKWNPKFLPELIPVDDFSLLHDLAHFAVAPVWARDLPDWGLCSADAGETNANRGYHISHDENIMEPHLFDDAEELRQEGMAYLLGALWCDKYDVPILPYYQSHLPRYLDGDRQALIGEMLPWGFSRQDVLTLAKKYPKQEENYYRQRRPLGKNREQV